MISALQAPLRFSLWKTVDDIDLDEWNRFRDPDDLFMDPRLLRVVEKSVQGESQIWYVMLRTPDGTPAAIACLSTVVVDPFVLAPDSWICRVLRQFQKRLPNLFYHHVLTTGVPLSAGQSYLRISPHADRKLVMKTFDMVMSDLARQVRARCVVFKELSSEELRQLEGFQQLGYHRADSLPQNVTNPQWRSLSDYLQQAMVSRQRWGIRKELKKVDERGLTVRITSNPDEIESLYTDEVHALYEAVYHKADRKLEQRPASFFRGLARELPENSSFCFITSQSRVLAFLCSIFSRSRYHMLFVGMDYERNLEFGLYFNAMLRAFGHGLEQGVSVIEAGQTADYFKHHNLMCHHEPRHILIKGLRLPMRIALNLGKRLVFPDYPTPDNPMS